MEKVYRISKLIAFVAIAIVALSACEKEITGDISGHEYVDLGLPSGLMWATCNVGANSPEEYGDYFKWDDYIGAASTWGGAWRVPTNEECQELVDECDWFFVSYSRDSRVSGYKVTGPNGNSIFLPAAGYRNGSSLNDAGEKGYYWSSTPSSGGNDAYGLGFHCFYRGDYYVNYYYRYYGHSVRPVISEFDVPTIATIAVTEITPTTAKCGGNVTSDGGAEVTARGVCWSTIPNPTIANNHTVDGSGEGEFTSNVTGLIPNTTYYLRAYATNKGGTGYGEEYSFITEQGHVDLGLPSGLKWATCNIGASSPEDYGDYFAWGETEPKSTYAEYNSITYGEQMGDISGDPEYDAATANWGSTWRMPTLGECEELEEECTWQWTTQNGVNGYKVIGPNGNHIFLPAAGYRGGSSLNYAGEDGHYWSSTPSSYDFSAYHLNFNSSNFYVYFNYRYNGRSVRPVSE